MALNKGKVLTAVEFAYQSIKDAILKGELEPGSKINIDELCESFNLSRVPIRGALDKLSAENLVVDIPRRGVMVQAVSTENLRSVFTMREMLEPLALIKAFDYITAADIQSLRELLDSQDHNSTDRNVLMKQNGDFHYALFRLANDETLLKVLDNLWAQSNRYRYVYYGKSDYSSRIIHEHYELLNAIASGDKQHAVDLLVSHIRRSQEMLLKMLKADPSHPMFNIVVG